MPEQLETKLTKLKKFFDSIDDHSWDDEGFIEELEQYTHQVLALATQNPTFIPQVLDMLQVEESARGGLTAKSLGELQSRLEREEMEDSMNIYHALVMLGSEIYPLHEDDDSADDDYTLREHDEFAQNLIDQRRYGDLDTSIPQE